MQKPLWNLSWSRLPWLSSPNSSQCFHTKLGGMNMGTDSPTQTDASMDVHHLPRGAGGGWSFCLIYPCSGPKSQAEDQGEGDEVGGQLYKCRKMLYEDDYHPELVQTQGTEDAISLVSSLSSLCFEAWISPMPFPTTSGLHYSGLSPSAFRTRRTSFYKMNSPYKFRMGKLKSW